MRNKEQNDWQEFKSLFGGGKIKICDTLRAVAPFGGLSVLIEFFARIGLVEQLKNRQFYQPESPNHYDPGQILVQCFRSNNSLASASGTRWSDPTSLGNAVAFLRLRPKRCPLNWSRGAPATDTVAGKHQFEIFSKEL